MSRAEHRSLRSSLSQPFFTFPSSWLGLVSGDNHIYSRHPKGKGRFDFRPRYNDNRSSRQAIRPAESQLLDYSRFDAAKIAFKLFAIILSIVFRRLPRLFKLADLFILPATSSTKCKKLNVQKRYYLLCLCLSVSLVFTLHLYRA